MTDVHRQPRPDLGMNGSYDPATQPKRPEMSLGDLLAEMTTELSELFRQEVELAKTEAKEEVAQVGRAAGMLTGAGLAGWLCVLFASFALAWLADQAMNRALAFGIVAAVWLVVAAMLATTGRSTLRRVRALPQTKQSLKEDMAWARAQKS